MQNEAAHRRCGFRSGLPIRLADGQFWHFGFDRGGGDREIFELLAAVSEAEDEDERCLAELSLAIHLFSLNYHVDLSAYRVLFDFDPGEDGVAESKRAFRALADATFGHYSNRSGVVRKPDPVSPLPRMKWLGALSKFATARPGRSPRDRRGESCGLMSGEGRP